MLNHVGRLAAGSIFCLVLSLNARCGTPLGGGGGGGTDPSFTVVKTDIPVRFDAGIKAGDDLIAFGTGLTTGVSYILPSTSPKTGTPVTDSSSFVSGDFAVGSRTIFLVGAAFSATPFQVSVFDVNTAQITRTFPASDIRVAIIPISARNVGNIQADGSLCVVICSETQVSDGKIIKVVDVSTATPGVISFAVNPAATANEVQQVAVNASTRQVVAVANNTIFIYDVNNPNASPFQIPVANGVSAVQMKSRGIWLIAIDSSSQPSAFLVNLSTRTPVPLPNSAAALAVSISDTRFGFFANFDLNDVSGVTQRAAVGTIPGPAFEKASLNRFIDGTSLLNGLVGFANAISITPDGRFAFLAGPYLQFSQANASFTVLPDPAKSDPFGTPAFDIAASSNTVGFKTSALATDSVNTTIGYIILP